MAHSYRRDGPGGIVHVTLAVGIIMALGLFTAFPDSFSLVTGGGKGPRMIATQGSADAKCQANSVETVVGTLGCAGARKAVQRERTTFASAQNK